MGVDHVVWYIYRITTPPPDTKWRPGGTKNQGHCCATDRDAVGACLRAATCSPVEPRPHLRAKL